MTKKLEILHAIKDQGILPLFFNKDTEVSIEVLRALYRAGVKTVEYTNRGEAALANFKEMRKVVDAEMPGFFLGIGTIKNAAQAADFIVAGADYIISPGLIPEVAAIADKNDVLWVPGAMTPSEIIAAENLGAKFVKLFPGNMLGPDFMSSIKELFPAILFMPTGGVDTTKENISAWFKSGVSAVGMGSKLLSKALLEAKDYTTIEAATKEVLATVKAVRV